MHVGHDGHVSLTPPTLRTARLLLRPFEDGDADALFRQMSDPVVMRYWDGVPWTDAARSLWFLGRVRTMAEEGTGVRLVVEWDGVFVGWLGVVKYDAANRSASLGYNYGTASWGQGIATEAARALLGWAFDTLDLNRVQAEADTRNTGSVRVLEKLGFQREGLLREDCVVNGEVSDSFVFGLLRREWRA